MNRRDFLVATTTSSAALALGGCNESNRKAIDYSKHPEPKESGEKHININKNKKSVVKLATSWPGSFPIMGTGIEKFAQRLKDISGGSLEIKIYPKNTRVQDLAVFDACSSGHIDEFHTGPYYWKGPHSAF